MSGPAGEAAHAERRGRALLAAGIVLGMALTAWGLVGSSPEPPARDDAVAMVNGQPLSRGAFERFAAAVAQERREAELPPAERERLLDRLIDEELLLQHGIRLGLARHEPTARRVIVQSVIAAVTGAAEDVEPTEADLREYHARHPDRFVRPGRVVVEALAAPVRDGDDEAARAWAARAAQALSGGGEPAAIAASLDGVETTPLPGGPLPVETVRRYLGPTAALRVQDLEPGQVSEPFRASASYLVLRVRERQPDRVPEYEEVARQVHGEWIRDRGEEALRRFLDDLRAAADVERADLTGEAAATPAAATGAGGS